MMDPLTISLGRVANPETANDPITQRLVSMDPSLSNKRNLFAKVASYLLETKNGVDGIDTSTTVISRETMVNLYWIPGRIEIGGKHTDYAGGNVIVCAINRGFAVLSIPRQNNLAVFHNIRHAENCTTGSTDSSNEEVKQHNKERRDMNEKEQDQRDFSKNEISEQLHDEQHQSSTMATISIIDLLSSVSSLPPEGSWSRLLAVALRRYARNFLSFETDGDTASSTPSFIAKGMCFGSNVAWACDLPPESGLSSSSAIICMTWLIFGKRMCQQNKSASAVLLQNDNALVTYLGCVENGQTFMGPSLLSTDIATKSAEVPEEEIENATNKNHFQQSLRLDGDAGIGTFGGSEDHAAIMMGQYNIIRWYSFHPTAVQSIGSLLLKSTLESSSDMNNTENELCFVVASSGVRAHKAGGNKMILYNDASNLAKEAAFLLGGASLVDVIREEQHQLRAAVQRNPSDLYNKNAPQCYELSREDIDVLAERINTKIEQACVEKAATYSRTKIASLQRRVRHFIVESEYLVPALYKSLVSHDYRTIGKITDESHYLTIHELRNTVPETASLGYMARELGAIGASAFGAGFGGSVYSVVQRKDAEKFCTEWRATYLREYLHREMSCEFFITPASAGALQL